MESPQRKIWLNFLSLLPSTLLTVLTIAIAFLRFYDQQDFTVLATIEQPRVWSNRLTVAAFVVALVAFSVVERSSCEAWDRRNRETVRQEAEAARAENERVERRQREIQRDAYGSVFRPTRNRRGKRTSKSRTKPSN